MPWLKKNPCNPCSSRRGNPSNDLARFEEHLSVSYADMLDQIPLWWAGQGDPVYAAHGIVEQIAGAAYGDDSYGKLDRAHAADVLERAAGHIAASARKLKDEQGAELADNLEQLAYLLQGHARRGNPSGTYKIVRLHQRGPSRTIKKGLTLAEAQAHCRDPETSSSTAKSAKARAYTAKHGPWFDGYEQEGKRSNPQRRHHFTASLRSKHPIPFTLAPHAEKKLRAGAAHRARKTPARHRPIPYRLNPAKTTADADAARELQLYAESTGELYGQRKAIEKNLMAKMRAGTYDQKKAPALWLYWFDAAAKRYAKENLSHPSEWSTVFTKATRELAAREWAEAIEAELRIQLRTPNPSSEAPSPSGTLTELGLLVEMTLASPREGKLPAHQETIGFHRRARLCTNARGRLIIVSGPAGAAMHRAATDARALKKYVREHWGRRGKGKVQTFDAANPRVPFERIAEIKTVVYATRKGRDAELVEYEHTFSSPRPVLARNATGLLVIGGKYRMTTHGIVG